MNRVVVVAVCCVGLLLAQPKRTRADENDYPRADLLIEANQLAQPEAAANFVVLDARSKTKYERAHVPQARWVDHNAWATAFGHGADAVGWSRRVAGLGVGAKTKVIVYDDMLSRDAARIWWILRYWGVDDVRLLNGGWRAWTDGDYRTETGAVSVNPAEFVAKARPQRLATKEQLLKSLGGGKLQIVDARSEREFCGFDKMKNKRARRPSPGAKQLEWVRLIDQEHSDLNRRPSYAHFSPRPASPSIDRRPLIASREAGPLSWRSAWN